MRVDGVRRGSWVTTWIAVAALALSGGINPRGLRTIDAQEASSTPSLAEQLPRIPAHSPEDALKTFSLPYGFTLELVAAEPDVVDPIDAAFDADGRMYVVEMRDYPFLPPQRASKYVERQPDRFGSIRLLTDTDGDGKMDRSSVFADGLRWPQSVICYKNGVFVLAPPTLYFMEDTNGDGVADVKQEVCTGFGTGNVQGLANGLEWGLDQGIYFASGRAGGEVKQGDQVVFTVGRNDVRLDPKTRKLKAVSGGEQFGHSFDDWGNRFVCNNSNHLEQVVLPLKYLERNPQLAVSNVVRTIAAEGAAAPVYRTSPPEPWRVVRTARRAADPKFRSAAAATELVATGFFTSATGVTVYRGGAYPPEFQGNVFIGDVGGNLVHRKQLKPNGIALQGVRTEQEREFINSVDNWFRPVNFVNAPDGTLYVLDMYWETIEHPASIPEDIKEHLDLESGNDRGRIYRVVSPGMQRFPVPKMSGMTAVQLVDQLRSPHGSVRETASRLIWEREDASAVEPLRALLNESAAPAVSRMHALWTLKGLGAVTAADVLMGLKADHPRLREQALVVSEGFAASPEAAALLLPAMAVLANDADLRVRWQLALSVGEFAQPDAISILLSLMPAADQDADLRIAILTAIPGRMLEFAKALLSTPSTTGSPLLTELVRSLGAASDSGQAVATLDLLLSAADSSVPRRLLSPLAEGAARAGLSLPQLASRLPSSAAPLWMTYRDQQLEQLGSASAEIGARISAVQFVGYLDADTATSQLQPLLNPQTSPALVEAAVRSLSRFDSAAAANAILAAWRVLGPKAKSLAIDGLLQSRSGATALLTGLADSLVKPAELNRDKQQLLMTYPQPEIRDRAKELLGAGTASRKDALAAYQSAATLPGDAVRGLAVYRKVCQQCHRAGSEGHLVGPDLVSVQNKSLEDLLISILDPNREAQPNFVGYTAQTVQGQVSNGLIAAETATSITLRRAESKEDVVQRDQIEELVSSGVSLMPEGMEKDITVEQMADLLAYIKSLQASPSKPATGG
jgi:putative membrane-bound dehydrogenase-like protein